MIEPKTETTLKLKVGDKAVVKKRLCGHCFKIGTKIIIRTLCQDSNPPHYCATEFKNKSNAWWVNDKEVKRV